MAIKAGFETGVLEKVKKTFQKMTVGVDDAPAFDYLVTMNLPPCAARRDAAYARAVEILRRQDLFSLSEEERSQLYASALRLLSITVDSTKQILHSSPGNGKGGGYTGPFLQYLTLILDTVHAASSLVKHELILYQEEKGLADFLGSEISSQFRSEEEIFNESEMNVYHCVIELINIAEPAIARYQEHRKKLFSKSDLERYNKALAEFQLLYSKDSVEGAKKS